MIRLGISFIILCSSLYAKDESLTEKTLKTEKTSIFSEIKNVSVMVTLCESKVNKQQIKTFLEKQLSLFGKLLPDSPENFGKGMSVLQVLIGPIADASTVNINEPVTYFPVTQVSMQLLTGAELISNRSYGVFGLVWEETSYVNRSTKQIDKQVEAALKSMLEKLQSKYSQAKISPHFYINTL